MKKSEEKIKKIKASLANIALFLSIFSVISLVLITLSAPTASAATLIVPSTEYPTIQDAIDAANPLGGDTILVYAGVYNESFITINKPLTLQGNSSTNTTIDAQGISTVISISASWVTVTGFTIKNGTKGVEIPRSINIHDNTISECNITQNNKGIYINYSPYNIISNNNILFNIEEGIYLRDADNNKIIDNNNVSFNNIGIFLSLESGAGNTVKNNIIDNNTIMNNTNFGFKLLGAQWNRISNNTILYTQNGYGIYIQMKTFKSAHNTIENNTIKYINGTGIFITEESSNNLIYHNEIHHNNEKGIYITELSNENDILQNNVTNNSFGLYIWGYDKHAVNGCEFFACNNNIIAYNNFTYNDFDGIYLRYSKGNDVLNNNVSQNGYGSGMPYKDHGNGIFIAYASSDNYVANNDFINNSRAGIHLSELEENYPDRNKLLLYDIYNCSFYNNTINYATYGVSIGVTGYNYSYKGRNYTTYSSTSINDLQFNLTYIFNSTFGMYIGNCFDSNFYITTIENSIQSVYGLNINRNIETNYRNYIPENNTVNGESIYHYYNKNYNPLDPLILNSSENLTQHNISNIGKISFYNCSNIVVANKTISNGTIGVFLHSSNNITINNNNLSNLSEVGLFVDNGYWHEITPNNTLDGETIHYYTNQSGLIIENKNLDKWNVSNVGKITLAYCNNVTLKSNDISNNSYGIFLYGSNDITMWDNNMSSPKLAGLFIEEGFHHYISTNNTANDQEIYYFVDLHGNESDPIINETNFSITHNNVSNVGLITYANCSYLEIMKKTMKNNYGSGIFVVDSTNVTIKNNEATDNCDGMMLRSSKNVTITQNTFSDNKENGYGNKSGLHLKYTNGNNVNYITNNNELNNNVYGIYIDHSINDSISFHNQTINSNSRSAIYIFYGNPHIHENYFKGGIMIDGYYSNPIIENNNFRNGSIGIYHLSYSNSTSKIENNTFAGFNLAAIYLMDSSSPDIKNNEIKDIKYDGIDVYHGDSAPYIYNNTIHNTGYMGIQLEDSNATIINNKIYDIAEGINVASNPHVPPCLKQTTGSNTRIENNTIWNVNIVPSQKIGGGYPSVYNSGIKFSGYSVGVILNNTIYNCTPPSEYPIGYSLGAKGYGIRVHDGFPSEISGNNCSNNKFGMVIVSSFENLKINNNTVTNNLLYGISIQKAANTAVAEGNNVSNNYEGFSLYQGDPLIKNNDILFNTRGIIIGSGSPVISNNVIEHNENGTYIPGGASPTITNNYINWSSQYGIYAKDSSLRIESNRFQNKVDRTGGISSYFYNCTNSTEITNNTYIHSHRAIYLMYTPALVKSNSITLVDGITSGPHMDDTVGIAVYHQSNATIENNNISGGDRGIGIEYDSDASANNNSIINFSYYGIFTRNINHSIIFNNTITNSSYGIFLYYSRGINITNNTMINDGIFIEGDQLDYWNTHNINNSNTVNGKPVYYWKNTTNGNIPSGAGEVILANSTNIDIQNQELNNCSIGIEIGYSSNINVSDNNASNNYHGILIYNSISLNITNNTMINDGIFIEGTLLEHWNTHNINISTEVNGKPVYYWKNQTGGTIPTGAGEVILANCTNVGIENQFITNATVGVELGFSNNNNITNLNVSNNIIGIYISDADENYINNTETSNNDFGFFLYNSRKNNINENNISSTVYYGVYFTYSDSNNITCNITSNNIYGFYLSNSNYNNVTGNNVSFNYYGIFLLNSIHNNLTDNTASSNDREGIYLDSSHHNMIINNNVTNNYYGFRLINSENNSLTNNSIFSNTDFGIKLIYSNENNISHNDINSNNNEGIYLDSSIRNNITHNDIYTDNKQGIYVLNSSENCITRNNITDNDYGIYLDSSIGNNISYNDIYTNNKHGFYILNSDENQIINNNVTENDYGIYLDSSIGNNITSNNATINDNGIYLWNSKNTTITSNNASLNNDNGITINSSTENKIGINNISNNNRGIYIDDADNNMITNNDIFNNTNYGIYLSGSENNSIIDNDLYYNLKGIEIDENNKNNIIYHNNLNNTNINAYDNGSDNLWDNGLEGNWWSDNPVFTDTDGNGICDSNYTGNDFVDNYPLANEDNDRVLVDDPWFWFIQSAVNFAESGWIVYAKSSTYLENVTINKSLTLIGENMDNTIIDSENDENVLFIKNTSYVNIKYFTIMNGTNGIHLNNSNYCIIEYNNITDNNYGILSEHNEFLTIQNNYINWSGNYGIYAKDSAPIIEWNSFRNLESSTGGITTYLYNCSNISKISNNTFINSLRAVYLMYSSVLVRDNNISLVIGDITKDDSVGIAVYHQSNSSVINNSINAKDSGIRVEYDSNATVSGNQIDNASYHGIFVRDASPLISQNVIELSRNGTRITQSSSPIIQNNWINWSGWYGINANGSSPIVEWNSFENLENRTGGISSYFYSCGNSTLISNNTYINSHRAVYLMYTSALVRDNNISLVVGNPALNDTNGIAVYHQSNATVINNTIRDGNSGIRVEYESNATVSENYITNTSNKGIYCRDLEKSLIVGNNVTSNTGYGIYLENSNNTEIEANQIIDNTLEGIHLNGTNGSHNNLINNNYINNNSNGIYLSYSNGNSIFYNDILNNHFGIGLYYSDENIINQNNASFNNFSFYLGLSDKNNLTGNNGSNSTYHGVILSSSSENIINYNIVDSNGQHGIELTSSSDWNNITDNIVTSNGNNGIYLILDSSNNTINENIVSSNNWKGIYLNSSHNNITNNNVSYNDYGVYLYNSSSLIYHNNFINNTNQAYDNDYLSIWHNGYPQGGNYWDDFDESSEGAYDIYSGLLQNILGSDGIVDFQYFIDIDSIDAYPLMKPIINNRVQRPFIRIDSNSDFDAAHGVSSGSGISSDPWIIENYDIDGGNEGFCVYIGNTTDYFEVIGNYLHDSSGNESLILNNVTNGTIKNNVISFNSYHGVYINNSSNNTIENNICSDNENGLYLNDSKYNNITANDINDNFQGVVLFSSDNISIKDNDIFSNENQGVSIIESNDINISANNVSNNGAGMLINHSSDIIIGENTISYNDDGLFSFNSSVLVTYNNISSNNESGIADVWYSDVIIQNNTITYNNVSGISNVHYSNSTINKNTISYNNVGILSVDNSSSIITYNNITYNTNGIDTYSGSNVTIQWNNIHNNANKSVRNFDSSINLTAWYNYWGSYPPDPSDFYGPVDYSYPEAAPFDDAGPD